MAGHYVKVSGTWQKITKAWVKVSGVWQQLKNAQIRVSGTWQTVPYSITIPAGAIALFKGATVPTGWTRFSTGDDKFIVGAGTSYTAGTDYGATTDTFAGTTNSTGGHSGGTSFSAQDSSGGSNHCGNTTNGAHSHTYSKSINIVDEYQDYILIQADSDTTVLPQDAIVLSATSLSVLSNVDTSVDRFVRGAASYGGTGGSATPSDTVATNTTGAHKHGSASGSNGYESYGFSGRLQNLSAGNHSHTATITVTLNTKQKYLSAWSPTAADGVMEINGILLWPTNTAVPSGYVACDGTNGTPDMRDYHLRIGTTANHGTGSGDNSASVSVTTSTNGNHEHAGVPAKSYFCTSYHSNLRNNHSHTDSFSQTVDQSARAYTFIMSTGG